MDYPCISNEKRRTLNEEKYTKLEVLRIKLNNESKKLKSLA